MRLRRILVAFLILITVTLTVPPAVADERWVEATPSAAGTEPFVDVRETAGGIVVDMEFAGFFVEERFVEGGEFVSLNAPGCGGNGAVGAPYLPFHTILIPVPNGPGTEFIVVSSDPTVVLSGVRVMPTQAPEPDCGSTVPDFALDEKVYGADRWFPEQVARITDDVVVRGQRLLVVEASPISFNPARMEVSVRSHLTLTIDLMGAADAAAEVRKVERRSVYFPTVAELEGLPVPDATPTGIEYLIIAHDTLVTAIQPLAEWKRLKGLTVETVAMSSIGTTSADLKTFLQSRYDSDPDLTYVLLVGDHPMVPSENLGGMVSDLYYSCLDGADYFPDVVMGRIAVQTGLDCEHVVDKILTFERDTVPGVWHGDFLMAALLQDYDNYDCEADRWFFETGTHAMHYIRDQVGMVIHTAATSDSLSCSPYDWRSDSYPHRFSGYAGQSVPQVDADLITSASQSTQDIADAINGGVSLVQHRDHGGVTGWGDPPFYNANVAALTNGTMTPIVFSINCQTGAFNSSGDCFAEAFMKKYPGGAVGVIAATANSYSGYNDLIVHGSYDSFWDDYDIADGGNIYPHSFRPAEAYLYGKYYMYHWEGAGSYTQLEFELFHWHGDPEMRAFTAVPVAPGVTVDSTIPVGASSLTVTVDVEGAMVAVTDDGNLLGRAEVAGGVALVALDPVPETTGTLDVVVTGHNLVPWQGTVEVIVPVGPWLMHRSHLCDDSGGNGDGIANPGETIIVPVTVENVGADDGTGLTGVLNSGSAYCTVSDPVADFPDAMAGAVVQSLPNHFAITMDGATPNGHSAILTLDWAASGGYTGSTVFTIPVCEALVITDVAVAFAGNVSAVVSWTTNVPASSAVTYGATMPPSTLIESSQATTSHSVEITGLEPCTDYFFEVASTSLNCYTTTDTNGGVFYEFTTSGGTPVVVDSTDTPMAIPDNNPTGASSTITVDSPWDVLDVDVLVNITHTYTGDLELLLISPAGSPVVLSNRNGGSGNNYTDTLFDDDAATSITSGSAPFTGLFQPEQPLSALVGQPSTGDWTFKVVDHAGVDTGTIDNWQLRLTVNEPCGAAGLIFFDDFEGGDTSAWSTTVP